MEIIYIYILAPHLYSKCSVNSSDWYNQRYSTLPDSGRCCWRQAYTTFSSHCARPPDLGAGCQELTAVPSSRELPSPETRVVY